jgi:hypothetical protein
VNPTKPVEREPVCDPGSEVRHAYQ